MVLVGDIETQTSPNADTVPRSAFAIDPAAIAAGLRPLRAAALPPGEREVRVWTGFGIRYTLYRLRTSGGNVPHGVFSMPSAAGLGDTPRASVILDALYPFATQARGIPRRSDGDIRSVATTAKADPNANPARGDRGRVGVSQFNFMR